MGLMLLDKQIFYLVSFSYLLQDSGFEVSLIFQ